jgi:hypothetical protein
MILSSLLVVWCTSCAGTSAVHDDTFVLRSPVTVKVLGFEGCPNTPELLYRTKLAATSSGRNLDVVYVDQRRFDADDLRRGWPAPTVLVNDADLMGMKQPTSPALGCRLYPNGLPSIEQLSKALRAVVPEQPAD